MTDGPDIEISDVVIQSTTTSSIPEDLTILESVVGEEVTTDSGNRVTVRRVTGLGGDPDDRRDLAVEVEACAGDAAGSTTGVAPGLFVLEVPGRRLLLPGSDDPREPELEEQRLAAGECATGWISYELPGGDDPTHVRLRASTVVRWRIPERNAP